LVYWDAVPGSTKVPGACCTEEMTLTYHFSVAAAVFYNNIKPQEARTLTLGYHII